eukprot:scaffold7207_cov520-Prasinococcus_capsulatus_cf.AAC.1
MAGPPRSHYGLYGFGIALAVAQPSQVLQRLPEVVARAVAPHLVLSPRNPSRRGDTNANLTHESFIDTYPPCHVEREMHLHHLQEELLEGLLMSVEAVSAASLADVALGYKKADVIHTVRSAQITPAVRYRHIHLPAMRTGEPLHFSWHGGHVEHLRGPEEYIYILHCVVL